MSASWHERVGSCAHWGEGKGCAWSVRGGGPAFSGEGWPERRPRPCRRARGGGHPLPHAPYLDFAQPCGFAVSSHDIERDIALLYAAQTRMDTGDMPLMTPGLLSLCASAQLKR
jgi:hypothetical protein